MFKFGRFSYMKLSIITQIETYKYKLLFLLLNTEESHRSIAHSIQPVNKITMYSDSSFYENFCFNFYQRMGWTMYEQILQKIMLVQSNDMQ